MFKNNIFVRSLRELKDLRCLMVTALLIALAMALKMTGFSVQLTNELRLSLTFVFSAGICMLFGPSVGIMAGIALDFLGYLAAPTAGFFPGFTLTAIVQSLIYGLWLYKGKVTKLRVLGAQACVNLICNIGLNTIWVSLMYGDAIRVLLPLRIYKNLLLLPAEAIVLFLVGRLLLTAYHRARVHTG